MWDDPVGRQEMERIMKAQGVVDESTNQKTGSENNQVLCDNVMNMY